MTEEAGGVGRGLGGRGRQEELGGRGRGRQGLQKQRTTEDAKPQGGPGATSAQSKELVGGLRQLNLEELSTCNLQLAERRNIKVSGQSYLASVPWFLPRFGTSPCIPPR